MPILTICQIFGDRILKIFSEIFIIIKDYELFLSFVIYFFISIAEASIPAYLIIFYYFRYIFG